MVLPFTEEKSTIAQKVWVCLGRRSHNKLASGPGPAIPSSDDSCPTDALNLLNMHFGILFSPLKQALGRKEKDQTIF